ncbi:MAG: DUF488 family protein [Armatimonadota bacterium]
MEWLELAGEAGPGCPVRVDAKAAPVEPLDCALCGRRLAPGELVSIEGYCSFGGEIPLGEAASLYADTLQPRAKHLRCAAPPGPGELWTIGHGTRPLEEFTGLLRQNRIEVLADIRTVPRSRRNPQYATENLAGSLRAEGFCYLHVPELGGLRKPRPDSPNDAWRNDSFRGYADYMQTSAFEAALGELAALARLRPTVIMCAETVNWRCHRSLVADALFARGWTPWHILGPAEPKPHRLTSFARVEGERVWYPEEAAGAAPPALT